MGGDQFNGPDKTTLNVLILYEDWTTGLCAKKTFDSLANELGGKYEFNHCLWQFDLLGDKHCEKAVNREAVDADMVVVSAHGNSELPLWVKAWFEKWLLQKRKASGALIGLFDRDAESFDCREVIRSYLQDAAIRGKMSFFTQTVTPSSEQQDYTYSYDEPANDI